MKKYNRKSVVQMDIEGNILLTLYADGVYKFRFQNLNDSLKAAEHWSKEINLDYLVLMFGEVDKRFELKHKVIFEEVYLDGVRYE